MEGTDDKVIQTMSCAQMWMKSSTSSKPCRSGRMRLVSPSSPSPQRTPTAFAFRMAMGESDYLCLCDDHLSLAPIPPIHRKHKSTICPYINFTLTNVKTVLSFIISCLSALRLIFFSSVNGQVDLWKGSMVCCYGFDVCGDSIKHFPRSV